MSPLRALARRAVRRLRRKLEHAVLGHQGLLVVPVGRTHADGVIDRIEVPDDGTLSVVGWSPDMETFAKGLNLTARGRSLAPSHVFRVTRPDLAKLSGPNRTRLGIVVEYVLPADWSGAEACLSIGDAIVSNMSLPSYVEPAYSHLYGNPGVWHREHIYNVGPPVREVSSEVLELCQDLPTPLLDFGCGAGVLVRALKAGGGDAQGLELDTPEMRSAAEPEAAASITYYPGTFPAPFADGAFRTVTCCEVLEHIPDYQGAVRELARLASEHVLITVPDMSAIPRGFTHRIVPWHLLERSHLNFFTQQSLGSLLSDHFEHVQFLRIGEVRCNRVRFFTSLVAHCRK